jgi:hypothetical protein
MGTGDRVTRVQVVSVNVGMPRDVEWRGKPVRTGTFKSPVTGPVRTGALNLAGDGQADLRLRAPRAPPPLPTLGPEWREAFQRRLE